MGVENTIFWSKVCLFLKKKKKKATRFVYSIFVGIFYPYIHFKNDFKLLGHPNFYQLGQRWCLKSAFSFLKWAFSTPSLTPLVKIGMTKQFKVTFKMFVWVKYTITKIMYIIWIASFKKH
jgi:hypothetical protein